MKTPLIIMLLVLSAPFVMSVVLLENKDDIQDNARGKWLQQTYTVNAEQGTPWQLLWRSKDCQDNCEHWQGVLNNLKIALGKHTDKLNIMQLQDSPLMDYSQGLFIADHNGLVLLSYDADQQGAYQLFKDLKVLIKHGGA